MWRGEVSEWVGEVGGERRGDEPNLLIAANPPTRKAMEMRSSGLVILSSAFND